MGRRALALLLPLLVAAAAVPAAEKAPAPGTPPAAAQGTGPAGPAPVVSFEALNLDLGAVPEGQDAVGTFVVRNSGKAELKLLQVKPG